MLACSREGLIKTAGYVFEKKKHATHHVFTRMQTITGGDYIDALGDSDEGHVIAAIVNACGVP